MTNEIELSAGRTFLQRLQIKVDTVCRGNPSLPGIYGMGRELLAVSGDIPDYRHLFDSLYPVGRLEESEKSDHPKNDGMGRCHYLCLGGGLFDQHLLFPEL